MKANLPTLPPIPVRTGPGRRNRSGPVPAWGLKLGGVITTLGVFLGAFGYAGAHLYVTSAPLQPATVAAVSTTGSAAAAATAAPSTAGTTTTTLTSTVGTTTRPAVTVTKKS